MRMLNELSNYIKNRKIINLFKTNLSKNVLISYTVYPIRYKNYISHNNAQEIITIAKVFKSFGYNVDLVHYLSKEKINFLKYDVIFGFGNPMSNSFNYDKIKKRIYYGTGVHPLFQNNQTLKMAKNFHKNNGKWLLDSCRIVNYTWPEQLQIVDAMILLGNESVKKTYSDFFDGKIYLINSTYNKYLDKNNINLTKTKNNSYLYFSSNGSIHRGLDKLLEIFKKNKSINLYISTHLEKEKQFFTHYKEYLKEKNIKYFGFTKIGSEKFINLIENCSFVILPTCSEGQSTSLLNIMYYGLIPITTKYSGINNKFIEIKNTNIESIEKSILYSQSLNNIEYKKFSKKTSMYIKNNNSIENYQNKLHIILKEILSHE